MTPHEWLTEEHARLREQAAALQVLLAKNKSIDKPFAEFQTALRHHIQTEDRIYYLRIDVDKRLDRELMHTLRNDHAGAIFTLESLSIRLRKEGASADWKKRFQLLLDVILPHFDREEQTLFPQVQRAFGTPALQLLLKQLQQAE